MLHTVSTISAQITSDNSKGETTKIASRFSYRENNFNWSVGSNVVYLQKNNHHIKTVSESLFLWSL